MSVIFQECDIKRIEDVVFSAARKLNLQDLYQILAEPYKSIGIEEKAKRYLGGPVNHARTGIPNATTRNPIQNLAHVICLNAPPGVHYQRIRNRLVLNLDLYYVSLDNAYNEEFNNPESPYPGYLLSNTIHTNCLPDRMKVELLGKYLERRVLQGKTRFLIDGFPEQEALAGIFEENVCLIRASIFVDGPKDAATPAVQYEQYVEANAPVREKLGADGRGFQGKAGSPQVPEGS
ncbi:MAG: hypothetical protein Q9219_003347 [cf. Caloplaca sp. 3 TL-2023]